MKVMTIVGARPQFIKASPVSRELRKRHTEILVHSGQHHDIAMSDVFFDELQIPRPDFDLAVSGGSHGAMTGEMLIKLDELMAEQRPQAVLVYGDTNTTLAGALAAVKLQIPVVHVEAGLRSFNRSMPEEINRVVADHVSDLLLCPTETAVRNLAAEGISSGVAEVGDVMLDTARHFGSDGQAGPILETYGVMEREYCFATLHRAANSDSEQALRNVIEAFAEIPYPIVWSVHPRTKGNIARFGLGSLIESIPSITITDPLPYTTSTTLLKSARFLMTDSGGMQKEAYFFEVPCITMREETEWVETVESGWNVLVGTRKDAIVDAVSNLRPPADHPDFYGDGHAASKIVKALEERYTPHEFYS